MPKPMPDARAITVAGSQLGLITRSQAHSAGMSDRQIRARLSGRVWRAVHRSVYVIGIAPLSADQELLAATLATGAPISHSSAAWAMQLVDRNPALPHVASHRRAGHRREHIVVHRGAELLPCDRTRVRGIPATTATRTLIDIAAECNERELRSAVHRALRGRLTHPDHLIERHLALRSSGRPGSAAMRLVLVELDADLALLESDLELLLLEALLAAGLPRPSVQYELEVAGRRFRADLAYPEQRLLIEGDGFGVHGDRDTFESDRDRQNLLVLAGWRVLRFTWRQIVREPARVAALVGAALELGAATGGRR